MKILAFAASLRKDSFNRKLVRLAADVAKSAGAEIDFAEFREFDMPLYDFDLQQSGGMPKGTQEMARRITAADGMIIASPEYNFSMPGTLKNAIDWLSRMTPVPLRGKMGFLCAASPSLVGGHRGLWALRPPLEGLGVFIYPDHFALAAANAAFDDGGKLKDAALATMLENQVKGYVKTLGAVSGKI
ncbi:MAG: NADPH-dependent oxidoreductase [Rhodospirillales bacterium]|nr:NADPH-dependent oxidoreductase [Rhodospirillales bacterium]